ncbi:unnamed protein product [Bursaphelenchus okinawaensis]|uniref:Uncharacterized protein n=1 Tax=Bursaphelenchus okinawaensis TaxID=465554 RepID=A0A811KP42_9BILA|nr:unnamed protein product [Bursaphelenchus okinawaensis]CAG9107718.1 unnamed protein product [Bursaphelenchus okinawaensis]
MESVQLEEESGLGQVVEQVEDEGAANSDRKLESDGKEGEEAEEDKVSKEQLMRPFRQGNSRFLSREHTRCL